MATIYAFTNENISSYKELYNFNNSKVLSVLGSGDQYFSSILFGASQVDVYDIEKTAWDYFLLKFYGMLILSYDDFFDYFVTRETDDFIIFNYLRKFLPLDAQERLLDIIATNGSLRNILEYNDINTPHYDDERIIPYLSKENFYKLKTLLSRAKMPKFHHTDLTSLAAKLKGEYYDILLASNIFHYMEDAHKKVAEFKTMLEKFNCPEIQALYCWYLDHDLKREFANNGFEITSVSRANRFSLINTGNVISLRRTIVPR